MFRGFAYSCDELSLVLVLFLLEPLLHKGQALNHIEIRFSVLGCLWASHRGACIENQARTKETKLGHQICCECVLRKLSCSNEIQCNPQQSTRPPHEGSDASLDLHPSSLQDRPKILDILRSSQPKPNRKGKKETSKKPLILYTS